MKKHDFQPSVLFALSCIRQACFEVPESRFDPLGFHKDIEECKTVSPSSTFKESVNKNTLRVINNTVKTSHKGISVLVFNEMTHIKEV